MTGDQGGAISVWHVPTGKLRYRFTNAHGGRQLTAMNFDNAKRRLLTGAGCGCGVQATCLGARAAWAAWPVVLSTGRMVPGTLQQAATDSHGQCKHWGCGGPRWAHSCELAPWKTLRTRCGRAHVRAPPSAASHVRQGARPRARTHARTNARTHAGAGAENGEVKVWNFSSGACLCMLLPETREEVTALLGIQGSFMKQFLVAGWDRKVRGGRVAGGLGVGVLPCWGCTCKAHLVGAAPCGRLGPEVAGWAGGKGAQGGWGLGAC